MSLWVSQGSPCVPRKASAPCPSITAAPASGRDAATLDAAIHRFSHAGHWRPLPATLEDVFIFLMRGALQ